MHQSRRLATARLWRSALALALVCSWAPLHAQDADIRSRVQAVERKVIEWRRDIHRHPELGGQETRTAKLVADHLRRLGLEVRTGIGGTGVVGLLKGARSGRTVALRADMDALPIKEETGLPFASQVKANYQGSESWVMHACGHDAHTAMLMGVAEVLAGMRDELAGTVMFIFQPAEEGPSLFQPGQGRHWGARLMLDEGLFGQVKPDAVFAMHVMPGPSGEVSWRSGVTTASSDTLSIAVRGKQGHGGMPWLTVDPVVASAHVLNALQPVVSRRAELTRSPVVVTIGSIHGGTGPNIVPERVDMSGTIRTYDEGVRNQVKADIKTAAEQSAASMGATAEVNIAPGYPTTVNDTALVKAMTPVIERAADGRTSEAPMPGAAEDFAYFAAEVPGLYLFLGISPEGEDPANTPPNHNPRFDIDEKAMAVGTRVMASLAVAFLQQ